MKVVLALQQKMVFLKVTKKDKIIRKIIHKKLFHFIVKKQLTKLVAITENIDDALTELIILGLKMKPHKIHLPWPLIDIASEIGIER